MLNIWYNKERFYFILLDLFVHFFLFL